MKAKASTVLFVLFLLTAGTFYIAIDAALGTHHRVSRATTSSYTGTSVPDPGYQGNSYTVYVEFEPNYGAREKFETNYNILSKREQDDGGFNYLNEKYIYRIGGTDIYDVEQRLNSEEDIKEFKIVTEGY